VGEPLGNIQLPTVLSRKRRTDPFEIGRGLGTQIHGNIPNRPSDARYQLDLLVGRQLKMKTSNRESATGHGKAVLDEAGTQTSITEFLLTERSGERAAYVTDPLRFGDPDVIEFS
jgi:uncharacterized protein (DUF111 family)